MRRAAIGLTWVVLALVSSPGGAAVLDALVARIDADVITWSQVVQEAWLRRLSGEAAHWEDPRLVRESLVKRRLLLAEAQKLRLDFDPNEVAAAVQEVAKDAENEGSREAIRTVGLDRSDLEERARELILVRKYLDLRKEMTFVPEAEIRAFHREHSAAFGGLPFAEVRDEVRAYLAERKYQRELAQWIDRQKAEGRVHLIPFPDER